MKAGTTWMQRIMSLLVFGAGPLPAPLIALSPWVEASFQGDVRDVMGNIDAQEHQRFLKSHLPFDALPYDPTVRYVYVGRDTRDVFMSAFNHYSAYTPFSRVTARPRLARLARSRRHRRMVDLHSASGSSSARVGASSIRSARAGSRASISLRHRERHGMGLATDSAACDDPRMTLRRNATRVHREPNAGIRAASPVRVLVVGPGGRSSELPQRVFEQAIDELRQMDVEVDARQGAGLRLPVFPASVSTRSRCAESFTNTLRGADGLVVVTPGFHGCLLATIENALRYAEDLRSGGVGGLAGRAVGTVVVAATRESSDASLERLRSIVHQHDGWPTPTGVAVSAEVPDALDAADPFSQVRRDIDAVLSQVVEFARMRRHYEATRRHLIP